MLRKLGKVTWEVIRVGVQSILIFVSVFSLLTVLDKIEEKVLRFLEEH